MGACVRERSSRKTVGKRWWRKRERRKEEERRMGSTPTALFIGGPLDLPIAVPSAVQHAPMALFQEVCEKIATDLSLTE
jgi:hypothetical protein